MALYPVIDQTYCVPYQADLIIKEEHSFSGDDFSVTDRQGRLWFRMDAKAFSINDGRVLVDATGRQVCYITKKMLSISGKWQVMRGNTLLMTIEPKIFTMNPNVKIYLNDGDRNPDYVARGDFRSRKFAIFQCQNGMEVMIAQCSKESQFASISSFIKQNLYDKQTYNLTVFPGIDTSFVSMLCMMLDEIYRDNSS